MSNTNRILRAGIIGCGWFGRVHVERLSAIPGVLISALSDPSVEAMEILSGKVPSTTADPAGVANYTDYLALLQHPGLDFVVIASPNR